MRWDVCHRGHPSDGKDEAKALGEIGGMHGDFEAKVVWSEGWEISCLLISMHACVSISSILRKASSICWCIYSPWGRVVIGPGNVVTYWLRRGRSNYLFKGVMEERIKKLNILTLINVGDPAFYFYFFNLTGVIFSHYLQFGYIIIPRKSGILAKKGEIFNNDKITLEFAWD